MDTILWTQKIMDTVNLILKIHVLSTIFRQACDKGD